MTADLHIGKPTEGSSSEIQTEIPSSLYVDELKFLMLAKWKKKCLHDYSVAHLISLCDGEQKHFTAITVSALVVTLIIMYLIRLR